MKYKYRTHFQACDDNKAAAREFAAEIRAAGFTAEIDDADPTIVDHTAPDETHDPIIDEIEKKRVK